MTTNKTKNVDGFAHLKLAIAAGAIILANEGRHGRPLSYHMVNAAGREPEFSCEPHEYLAVVPWKPAVPETGEIAVWQISDMEWWIGAGTRESILATYMEATGVTHEEATGSVNDWPEPLTPAALDELKFIDSDEDEKPIGPPRTFREQLAIEVAQGGQFPRLFACYDW